MVVGRWARVSLEDAKFSITFGPSNLIVSCSLLCQMVLRVVLIRSRHTFSSPRAQIGPSARHRILRYARSKRFLLLIVARAGLHERRVPVGALFYGLESRELAERELGLACLGVVHEIVDIVL